MIVTIRYTDGKTKDFKDVKSCDIFSNTDDETIEYEIFEGENCGPSGDGATHILVEE